MTPKTRTAEAPNEVTMIGAECRVGRHDGFDEQDAAEGANPGEDPYLIAKWQFMQPCERRDGNGIIWWLCPWRTIA